MTDESLPERRLKQVMAIYLRLEQRVMALPKYSAERESLMREFEVIARERRRVEAQVLGVEQR